MRVKICGIRSAEDAAVAMRAGANAIGFLVGITHLAEDKLTDKEAKDIIATVPPFVSTVMVTHLTDKHDICGLARYLGVSTVQIHDYISPEDTAFVKESLPFCKIIKAVHVTDEAQTLETVQSFQGTCDALLLDSRTKERLGGTGMTHDWGISRRVVEESRLPVILAGGLTDGNVYDAVMKVRPYGVDVNSGVEKDGWKDFARVKKFADGARRAFYELGE